MPDDAPILSPQWWVNRLYKRLIDSRGELDFYESYYNGDHPLPWLAPQARDEFRRILAMTRSNYCGLVCDTYAEGITVEGFRFGADEVADVDTWRIWQGNNLDADSDKAILDALIYGRSFLLVAPNPVDPGMPRVWVEHPAQAVVEHEPGTSGRVRAAGLKVWDDDWTQEVHATLYLPGGVFKFAADRPRAGVASSPQWRERSVQGESWPAPNPLGVVPLVDMPNNPRLLAGGVSELSDVTDSQDRVNKTLADRLITQDYGAFPQKWAVAWPNEDDTGAPNRIDVGRNRMVTTEVTETRFGQWDSAPLDPYSAAKREDVKDIAARKRIPADYLLGELNNVNGETLKASRAGLVAVTKRRRRAFAEAFEETMRLARQSAGLPAGSDAQMETIFSNPEFRTEGELTDATLKKYQAGIVSLRQAREDLGYTATQIERLAAEDETAVLDPLTERLLRPVTGQGQSGDAPVG